MKIDNNFQALFNPFIKQLAVQYGNTVSNYTFEEIEEWTKISFNGDPEHPNYLHVQLDYDECLQLLFYPRQDNDESLHEDEGVYFYSNDMNDVPDKIKLIYNDIDWEREYNKLSQGHFECDVEQGL